MYIIRVLGKVLFTFGSYSIKLNDLTYFKEIRGKAFLVNKTS